MNGPEVNKGGQVGQEGPENLAFVEDALSEADAVASVEDPAYTFRQALEPEKEASNG